MKYSRMLVKEVADIVRDNLRISSLQKEQEELVVISKNASAS